MALAEFSASAGAKIIEATKIVLSSPADRTGKRTPNRQAGGREFWAKLTDAAPIGSEENRWQYAWTKQYRTATGWTDAPLDEVGREGTTSADYALNSIENPNSATGYQGNGIDHSSADYPAGFQLWQASVGQPVVRMFIDFYDDDDGNEQIAYSFSFENAEDGTCSVGS